MTVISLSMVVVEWFAAANYAHGYLANFSLGMHFVRWLFVALMSVGIFFVMEL